MRRWVWRILLTVAAVAALTVGASARSMDPKNLGRTQTPVGGVVYDYAKGTVDGYTTGIPEKLVILDTVEGRPITQISKDAFEGCTTLKTVEIGNNIKIIDENAFLGCVGLTDVYFSDSVTEIQTYAFSGCKALNRVVLPKLLTAIRTGTFFGCEALSFVYIPSSVSAIEALSFEDTSVEFLHRDSSAGNPTNSSGKPIHKANPAPGNTITPATCSTQGWRSYTYLCVEEECGTRKFEQRQRTPATPGSNHESIEPIEAIEATCIVRGYGEGKKCKACGMITETPQSLGYNSENHKKDPQEFPGVDSTCTEAGYTAGTECPDCRAVLSGKDPLKLADHKWERDGDKDTYYEYKEIKEPSCTAAGSEITYYNCTVCKTKYQQSETPLSPTGHHYEPVGTSHTIKYDCEKGHVTVNDWFCTNVNCGDEQPYYAHCDQKGEGAFQHNKDTAITEEYLEHLIKAHSAVREDPVEHTPDRDYVVTKEPTCTETGLGEYIGGYICTVCEKHMVDEDKADGEGEGQEDPGQDGEENDGSEEKGPVKTVVIPALGHDFIVSNKDEDVIITAPTCETPGEKRVEFKRCSRCDKTEYEGKTEAIPALGHDWGDFQAAGGNMPEQAEDCTETPVTGTASCMRCGKESGPLEISIPGKLDHRWGEWVITDPPTATKPGKRTRTCTVCKVAVQTEAIAATGSTTPSDPDDSSGGGSSGGGSSGGNTSGGNSGTSTPDTTSYRVDVIQASNGTASASRSTATAGTQVTLTVSASSGYELDMLRVTTSTSVVSTTNLGGGQYRFTMPAANVEVRASFARKAASSSWTGSSSSSSSSKSSSQSTAQTAIQSVPKLSASRQIFSDIPASHWAAGEINWANQMGYMNGTANGFDPNGNITFQQMWMVMARLTGSRPASMADARRWAVNGGFADGSAPEASVTRQQLVTALYRFAHLMGTSNRNTTTLAGFPDSRTVPSVAREPFAWAVANGIIGGNSNGRLDPHGTLTRAQFAVILYRFSQRV